jgi:hypothetical protein
MNRQQTTYIECPDCDGLGHRLRTCDCKGAGCSKCKGEGVLAWTCTTCNGREKIPVTEDEGLEIFHDITLAEALRCAGNKHYRRERWR